MVLGEAEPVLVVLEDFGAAELVVRILPTVKLSPRGTFADMIHLFGFFSFFKVPTYLYLAIFTESGTKLL